MEIITTILISVLSGGVTATLVSVFTNKWSEKETRLFNAKLEAYSDFIDHIQDRFLSLLNDRGDLKLPTLLKSASKCLLVSSTGLSEELKEYLIFVSDLYEKCGNEEENKEEEEKLFAELWRKSDTIAELMRQDLGIK